MKKIFTLIIAFMVLALPTVANGSDSKSPSAPVTMDVHPIDDIPQDTIPRAPMRVCVEAWYDAALGTISVNYAGEASGEVNLYCDGVLVATAQEINAVFMLCEFGFYTIEILTESWTAIGTIEI